MRRLAPAVLVLLGLSLTSSAALAQRVELYGSLDGEGASSIPRHHLGDPRYLVLGDLLRTDGRARFHVLDLTTRKIMEVPVSLQQLDRKFGRVDARYGPASPEGDLVVYSSEQFGLLVRDDLLASPRRTWYAKVDAHTGVIIRSKRLADVVDGERLELIGTDAASDTAWMWLARPGRAGMTEVILQRLDLKTLTVSDAASVTMPTKVRQSKMYDHLSVHASRDYTQFAIVEYHESRFPTSPAAQVHFIDATTGSSFAVPAPTTAYGVAFSGPYAFLGSSDTGKIARVDLAAQRIDKTVAGPAFLHHLVLSADGKKLYAFASSRNYDVYDAPTLARRTTVAHARGISSAMEQLFGGGVASSDGQFFLVARALTKGGSRTGYVIGQLTN